MLRQAGLALLRKQIGRSLLLIRRMAGTLRHRAILLHLRYRLRVPTMTRIITSATRTYSLRAR